MKRTIRDKVESTAELLTDSSIESKVDSSPSSSTERSSTGDDPKANDRSMNSPLGWPIRKADAARSSVSAENGEEKKTHLDEDDSKLKKLSARLSGQFLGKWAVINFCFIPEIAQETQKPLKRLFEILKKLKTLL